MVILRAGLYERVSTDEQAKYGYSIKTQIDALEEYCEKNKIKTNVHKKAQGAHREHLALARFFRSRTLPYPRTATNARTKNIPAFFAVSQRVETFSTR